MAKKSWVRKSAEKMKRKGTKGSLTAIARKAGYDSPLSFARHVMANKEDYPSKTVAKANWAKNVNA